MRSILLAFSIILIAPFASHAQSPVSAGRAGLGWSFEGGLGFTAKPETFLMQFAAPYKFNSQISLGPQLQIGTSDATTLVATSADARLRFDTSGSSEKWLRKFEPFVNGGLGLAYVDRNSDDGVGFLLDLGFGVSYRFSRQIRFQSSMQFNIIPGGAAGEKFFYSWQIAGVRYVF